VTHQEAGPENGKGNSLSREKRPVTLFSATLLVIANMIGTGVFTTLGLQVAGVRSPFAVLLLWVLGGLSAFCGALSYGELGAMMPRSGGEYTYLSRIFHPAVGFLAGWVSIVAGFAAPIALGAIALGHYVGAISPGIDKTALAASVIVVLSVVHATDVRFGCHFQNLFTAGKIFLIVSFIVAGFFVPEPQPVALLPNRGDVESIFSPGFSLSLVYVFYAYSGWNASAYIAGEIPNPERSLPLSLFLGTLFVSLCYVLLNFVFLYTVPLSELAGKINVGYLSAKAAFGGAGSRIMTLLISLALISTLSSMIMVGPRVTQTMGEDMKALRVLAKRNKRGAPVRAIVLQSSVALLLTFTGTFDIVLTYVGFTLALFVSMSVLGVFVLRVRKPHMRRPFKTWGYPVTPALFLILNGWMIGYLLVWRSLPSLLGLLTVALGFLFYKLLAHPSSRS
jgi:APA family basic amino acid/polyamine antiporter